MAGGNGRRGPGGANGLGVRFFLPPRPPPPPLTIRGRLCDPCRPPPPRPRPPPFPPPSPGVPPSRAPGPPPPRWVPVVTAGSPVSLSGVLRAGSGVYVRCLQPPGGGAVTLAFSAPGPVVLDPLVVPQFAVVRIR